MKISGLTIVLAFTGIMLIALALFNKETKIDKFTAICDAKSGMTLGRYCIKKDVVIMEMPK
jgi:hypothetical protein